MGSGFVCFEGDNFLARGARFFQQCPFRLTGVGFGDILRSNTSFSVTGAGHWMFHPRGRHGAF